MPCINRTLIQKFIVYHLVFFFILTPFLASCGGGGTSSDNNRPTALTEEEIVANAAEAQNRSAQTAISGAFDMANALDEGSNLIRNNFGTVTPTQEEIEDFVENNPDDSLDLLDQLETISEIVQSAAEQFNTSMEELISQENIIADYLNTDNDEATASTYRKAQIWTVLGYGIALTFLGGAAAAAKGASDAIHECKDEDRELVIGGEYYSTQELSEECDPYPYDPRDPRVQRCMYWQVERLVCYTKKWWPATKNAVDATLSSAATTIVSLGAGTQGYKKVKFTADVASTAGNVQSLHGATGIRSCQVNDSNQSQSLPSFSRQGMVIDYENMTAEDIYIGTPDETGTFHNVPPGEWTFIVFIDGHLRTVTGCVNTDVNETDTIEVEITPIPIDEIGDLLENIPDETGVDENDSDTNTVTDYDGNVYSTITISDPVLMVDKVWMAENLKTTHYADGTPLVSGMGLGEIDENNTTKYWFVTEDSYSNKERYGLLYTWTAAMNGAPSSDANPSGVQGICPNGWHLPSTREWSQMVRSIEMEECDQILPDSYDISIPMQFAGYRTHMGIYESVEDLGFFWTTEVGNCGGESAGSLYFDKYNSGITTCGSCGKKVKGLSVRCVKD
jgi:uncharacterized protein (TIGR02145 family)